MEIPYTVQPRPDTGLFNAKMGVWLFLASEVMLFGALFTSYILLRVGAPEWPHGELNIPLAEGEPHALVQKIADSETFPGATEVIRIDGLRVEYPDGFGLARASNTTPVVVLRFEANDAAALARIQNEFRKVLSRVKPGAALPF